MNWGPNATQGFRNALATTMQMGAEARQAKQQNALMAQRQQALDIQGKEMEAKANADARKAQQGQFGTLRRLLEQAGDNPMQAFEAARSMDMDLSNIPQPGTPEFEPWRKQQMFIMDALEAEGDNLPGLAREVMFALPENQRDPNSAAFRSAFTAALENKYAAEYTDAQGNTRRRAIIGQQGSSATPPRPEGLSDGDLYTQARQAIANGADAEAVRRRLEAWGVRAQ